MSELLSELKSNESSNSMPVRDAELFLYTSFDELQSVSMKEKLRIPSVAVNIGASGIDGIISSATGFAEGSSSPTTLLIGGDLATLHDLNVFHNLSQRSRHRDSPVPQKTNNPPLSLSLTSIIVNNDGGGIFSFLPIAKHGNDVSFETFFGTPTNSFHLERALKPSGFRLTMHLSTKLSKRNIENPCFSKNLLYWKLKSSIVTKTFKFVL